MTTREIQNLLALYGATQAELSRITGYTESEVSKNLSGARRNPKVRAAIVRAIRKLSQSAITEEQLFGADFEASVRASRELGAA